MHIYFSYLLSHILSHKTSGFLCDPLKGLDLCTNYKTTDKPVKSRSTLTSKLNNTSYTDAPVLTI